MSTSKLNMPGNTDSGRGSPTRNDAAKAAKRTAIILGLIAVAWYFGFMALRTL